MSANPRSYRYGEPQHVVELRAELAKARKQLRYERNRVDQWRRRYGALQMLIRDLKRGAA